MWLTTQWKLRRALCRYRRDGDVDAVLGADWSRSREIFAFFREIVDRLHGEEITRLRQKQAEYLALQNQINPHFLYNALEAIRSDALLADCADIAETTEALATFFRYTISNVQEYVTFSDELDDAENYFTIQRCRFGDKLEIGGLKWKLEDLLEARYAEAHSAPLCRKRCRTWSGRQNRTWHRIYLHRKQCQYIVPARKGQRSSVCPRSRSCCSTWNSSMAAQSPEIKNAAEIALRNVNGAYSADVRRRLRSSRFQCNGHRYGVLRHDAAADAGRLT